MYSSSIYANHRYDRSNRDLKSGQKIREINQTFKAGTMKANLKLKALIALAMILVSGLASSNVVSNSNVLRVSNAYDPPSFGIESRWLYF
jgi:hypothetical protein